MQFLSRHLLSSSPFFTSQQSTSSLAATTAWPPPVFRAAEDPDAVLDSGIQMAFAEAELIRPKLLANSYLLRLVRNDPRRSEYPKGALTDMTLPSFSKNHFRDSEQNFCKSSLALLTKQSSIATPHQTYPPSKGPRATDAYKMG